MQNRRPLIITFICIFGFAGVIFAFPMALSDEAQTIGSWYPPFLLLSAVTGLVCFTGLWAMKRWSIVAYAIFAFVSQIVLVATGIWSIVALIVPGIIIAIALSKYSAMTS